MFARRVGLGLSGGNRGEGFLWRSWSLLQLSAASFLEAAQPFLQAPTGGSLSAVKVRVDVGYYDGGERATGSHRCVGAV